MRSLSRYLRSLGLGILFLVCGQSAHAWSLNDFSVLIPLPVGQQFSQLLKPGDAGESGPLFPKAMYDRLPPLVNPGANRDEIYEQYLRLVGVRLDPCFSEGENRCRRQIRLVWQPVFQYQGTTSTGDAALHTFYEFDESKWAKIVSAWAGLASGSEHDALQVHPRIKAEGMNGPYWTRLRSILLRYCGAATLVRSTVMTLNGGTSWTFFGLDWVNGRERGLPIPRVDRRAQAFTTNSLSELSQFDALVQPMPSGEDMLISFLMGSAEFRRTRSQEEIQGVIRRAFVFENPRFSHPGNVDCVSCHVAQTVRAWGQAWFPNWDWARDFADVRFVSSRNLENRTVSPLRTNRLRAFGYFDADPVISQRVINETALVADRMKAAFFQRKQLP